MLYVKTQKYVLKNQEKTPQEIFAIYLYFIAFKSHLFYGPWAQINVSYSILFEFHKDYTKPLSKCIIEVFTCYFFN